MISVQASDADRPVVREFFELFKTPWQFHTAGAPAKVLLCAGPEIPAGEAELVIVYASGPPAIAREADGAYELKTGPGPFRHGEVALPVYGRRMVEAATQQVVCRRGRQKGRPWVWVGIDLFGEIRHLLTKGQPAEHAGTPTLEGHVAFLRDLILSHSLPLVEIPPCPAGHEFTVCLTHDVDHPGIRNHQFDHTLLGFLWRATVGSVVEFGRGRKNLRQLARNWGAVLRLPLVQLGLARDFWQDFDQYVALEAGLPSTFFLIPEAGRAGQNAQGRVAARRAARYRVADLAGELQRLKSGGREIGVHGLDAWRDVAAGRAERERIAGVVGGGVTGIRMHWLYFDDTAAEKLDAAGYVYDTTVGYNDTVGYRAGTGQVYRPLHATNLCELPLLIMDTALFYPSYLNLSPRQARERVRPLIEFAVRLGGVMTINWHDRSLAPERLWGDFYAGLLEQLKARQPWFATASQAVAWFRKRRMAAFDTSPSGAGSVTIKLSEDGNDPTPPLRVRVFQPGLPGAKYSELPVHNGLEVICA